MRCKVCPWWIIIQKTLTAIFSDSNNCTLFVCKKLKELNFAKVFTRQLFPATLWYQHASQIKTNPPGTKGTTFPGNRASCHFQQSRDAVKCLTECQKPVPPWSNPDHRQHKRGTSTFPSPLSAVPVNLLIQRSRFPRASLFFFYLPFTPACKCHFSLKRLRKDLRNRGKPAVSLALWEG